MRQDPFEVFEDSLKVRVTAEFTPGRIDGKPGVVLVAEVDGAAKPMESFRLVAFKGEVGGEAVGHLAVGFGGREGLVDDEGGGAFAIAKLHIAEGDGGIDDAEAWGLMG